MEMKLLKEKLTKEAAVPPKEQKLPTPRKEE